MTWYSQAGQDEWVQSIVGDRGFFVDVGAYDGIEHSNTYALELLGWNGLCIEPGPSFECLRANRSCAVAQVIAGRQAGHGHLLGDVAHPGGSLPVATLAHLLDPFAVAVDYLSIDVEGWELEVLSGMDFERWPTRLITIEHNLYRDGPALKEAIHAELTERGFERVVEDVIAPGYGRYEDWYASEH